MDIPESIYHLSNWGTVQDIMDFDFALPIVHKQNFLMTCSALAWTVQKLKNYICFEHKLCDYGKTVIKEVDV